MASMPTRHDVAVAFLSERCARRSASAAWARKTCPPFRLAAALRRPTRWVDGRRSVKSPHSSRRYKA